MTSATPTASAFPIFCTDWFSRSKDYTTANTEMKLDWENGRNDKFSSFLYSISNVTALLKNNVALAEELKTIAVSLGVYDRVGVTIDPASTDSMTDGKRIIISKKFDYDFSDSFDTMDLLIGLLCHESSHCLFTDFNYMETLHIDADVNSSIVHWFHNVIEDEMIETKLGMKYPGYINFITKLKYYYFDLLGHNALKNLPDNELNTIMQLFLYVIRYPKYMNELPAEVLTKYSDLFIQIKGILGRNGCLNPKYCPDKECTHNSMNAALDIYDLIKKYVDEEKKDEGTGVDVSDDCTSIGSSDKNYTEQEKEVLNDGRSVFNKMKRVMNACAAASESESPRRFSAEMTKRVITIESLTSNNGGTAFQCGGAENIGDAMPVDTDRMRYNKIVRENSQYINIAKKIIVSNTKKDVLETAKFRRNGTIDSTRLAEAMCGVNTIYRQQQVGHNGARNQKYAVVLMLDESGSMGITYDGRGNKKCHDLVTELAIIIAEAVKSYPDMELYIYGHGDNVVPYLNKSANGYKSLYAITARKLQYDQNEAISYRKILDDVRSQTKLPIVAINITDSLYMTNFNELADVVADLEKKDAIISLISLAERTCPATSEINDTVYGDGNWASFDTKPTRESITAVVNTLSRLIKKNMNRKLKKVA